MKRALPVLVAALSTLGSVGAWGANLVTVESRSLAIGEAGVNLGVFVDNDLEFVSLVVPLEFRSVSGGAYVTGTFSITPVALADGGRIGSAIEHILGNPWESPLLDGALTQYFNTPSDPNACSGPTSSTWAGGSNSPNADGSPDAVMWIGLAQTSQNPDGSFANFLPGSDIANGVASLNIAFDANGNEGVFEIDTMCAAPGNHLIAVDVLSIEIDMMFTKGIITIGNPPLPPIVDDIPDQVIDEGGIFATISLDDFVFDLDDPDANLTWTASGQTELIVTIDGNRVATISIPDPDWSGSETVTFTATDPSLESDSDPAIFTVNPVNDPPVLTSPGPQIVPAGDEVSFALTATDIDNTSISLGMVDPPPTATLSADGAGNGTFTWTTGCLDEGVHVIKFFASDGLDGDSVDVTITVLSNPDTLVASRESVDFFYQFAGAPPTPQPIQLTDPGCGELAWEAVPSEPWLLVTPNAGTTPTIFTLNVDTAGLPVGTYTAELLIAEIPAAKANAVQITIPVSLSVEGTLCHCPWHSDPIRDSILNVLDVVKAIQIVFHGFPSLQFVDCPFAMADVNCDCVMDVLDVVLFINHVFHEDPTPFCAEGGACKAQRPPAACRQSGP